mmetsp:Transcript_19165/g.41397  ORF Transcript_19165/g.41397 Transcript_19165/m.41397 type:complete len:335 (+) Transcript_19165:1850-2854(+)
MSSTRRDGTCARPLLMTTAPLSSSSFSLRATFHSLGLLSTARATARAPFGVISFSESSSSSSCAAPACSAAHTMMTPLSVREVSLRLRARRLGWAWMRAARAGAASPVMGLSLMSRRTRQDPAVSPFASAIPPWGPTLLLAMRKSSMRGARDRTLAMCSAPWLSLMLLKRCSCLRLLLAWNSSSTARHAWMEQPTFCRERPSRAAWLVMASAHARTPFSPRALSLRFRVRSFAEARALHTMRSASRASSSGRPAMMSLMSASVRLPATFLMASAATAAASRPKLFVLNLIFLTVDPGASMEASTSVVDSLVRKSRLPVRSTTSAVPPLAPAAPS